MFFIFCAVPLQQALAQTPEERAFLMTFNGRIRLGMELELTERPLAQLMGFFDFFRYQHQHQHQDVLQKIPEQIILHTL